MTLEELKERWTVVKFSVRKDGTVVAKIFGNTLYGNLDNLEELGDELYEFGMSIYG